MKKRLKNPRSYWRLGILLFSISLLLWNCQKEDYLDVIPTENTLQHKKISSHSLEDLQDDFIFKETSTNFGLLPELHATNNLKSKGNNAYVIDIKSIKKISKKNYTSYTFIVDRASNPKDVIENLVIEKKSDTIRGYFIKYKLDPNYLDKLSRGEKAAFKASIKRTSYQKNISELLSLINNPPKNLHARERLCFYQTTVVIKKCDSDKQHSPGEVCHEKGDRRPGYIYYTNLVCYGVSTGGSGNPWGDDSDSSYDDLGDGHYGGGEDNNDGSESTPNIPCNDPIHGCSKDDEGYWNSKFQDLSPDEERYLLDYPNVADELSKVLDRNPNSPEAKKWVRGQIQLEALTRNIPWKVSAGKYAGLEYTHSHFDGSRVFLKLKDGSIVVNSSSEQTLTKSGDLRDKYNEFNPNDRYSYIKTPGGEWAEMLFNPDNLGDGLKNLFAMAGKDLGKNFGRYVLPIEDIKILIDGKDFDGQDVSRWKAAGFLFLAIVPGGKVLKVATKVTDATVIALKLGGGTFVVDTIKHGLKVVTNNNVVKFINKAGEEIASVVDGVMTFNFDGFGGKVITQPNKTTTIIGKWKNGTDKFIDSGLSKSGKNTGGLNVLSEVPDPNWDAQQIWDNLNEPWLRDAAKRSDVIRTVSDPLNMANVFKDVSNIPSSIFNNPTSLANYMKNLSDPKLLEKLSFYGREIKWLSENGFIFNTQNFKFIR